MTTSLSIHHRSYLYQFGIFAAFALLATAAAAQTYTVTDLGTLGRNSLGSYSTGQSINASGQVAGESSASSTQTTDPAFLYSNGQLIDIGSLGGEYGNGRGINTAGDIAGYSTLPDRSFPCFPFTRGGNRTLWCVCG